MATPLDLSIGLSLRRLLARDGRPRAEIAAAVGLSEFEIVAIEKGTRRVRAAELFRICEVLGVKVGNFYGSSFRPSPQISVPTARKVPKLDAMIAACQSPQFLVLGEKDFFNAFNDRSLSELLGGRGPTYSGLPVSVQLGKESRVLSEAEARAEGFLPGKRVQLVSK